MCWGREVNVQENHNPNTKQKPKLEQKDNQKEKKQKGGTWWFQLVECPNPDLGVVSSSPMWSVEIT